MKAYVITNAEKLKEVVSLMKWQNAPETPLCGDSGSAAPAQAAGRAGRNLPPAGSDCYKEKDKVAAFARVWSATERKEPDKAKKLSARIEIGRNAQVFKVIGTEVSLLGTMNLSMARAFVADMEAVK